jgi:hypothetical protein
MNMEEASKILDQQISAMRGVPYSELRCLVEKRVIQTPVISGPSGVKYYLEIEAFWDNHPGGNIRLIVSIDDGGMRAYHPLTQAFIKAPDNSFVGE